MTDSASAHFEPIFPSHAIERCTVSIAFVQDLPQKAFQKVVDRARTSFRNAGLESAGGPSVGFQVDLSSGRAMPFEGPRPLIFMTTDQATQFIIASNSLIARTGRYVRWQPFSGQIEELLLPLLDGYVDVVSIANVQLEYVDRFIWTGDWSTFRWRDLLQEHGPFLSRRASQAQTQWHTHSGWFEDITGGRRLINVNIDVVDLVRPDGVVPSVGILTLMRDAVPEQAPGQTGRYWNGASIQAVLEQLHNELKRLLEQIITAPMAERIGLKH
jgi:uncharacterized protein (TIGR04255 family)